MFIWFKTWRKACLQKSLKKVEAKIRHLESRYATAYSDALWEAKQERRRILGQLDPPHNRRKKLEQKICDRKKEVDRPKREIEDLEADLKEISPTQ